MLFHLFIICSLKASSKLKQVCFIILPDNAKRKTGYNVQIHIVPSYNDTNLANKYGAIAV